MSELQLTNGKTPPPMVPGKKRIFPAEYKKAIGARISKGKESIQAVADELGLNSSVVRRWSRGEGLGTFGGDHEARKKMSPATKKKISEARRKQEKLKKGKRKYVRVDEDMPKLAKLPAPVKEAIGLLKLGQKWMYHALQTNVIAEFDEAHDLSRMALRELLKLKET